MRHGSGSGTSSRRWAGPGGPTRCPTVVWQVLSSANAPPRPWGAFLTVGEAVPARVSGSIPDAPPPVNDGSVRGDALPEIPCGPPFLPGPDAGSAIGGVGSLLSAGVLGPDLSIPDRLASTGNFSREDRGNAGREKHDGGRISNSDRGMPWWHGSSRSARYSA